MTETLTSDNIQLSRLKVSDGSTVDLTDLPKDVAGYVRDSVAENTRRAYQSDLRHFELWGGFLPASPETVAAYLAAHADHLSVTTLIRRLASLSKVHQTRGLSNPIRSELVRAMLRGIKRKRRRTPLQAKPLLRDDLLLVLDAIGNSLRDIRDRALLLIGFAAALRRSELVALDVADVQHVPRGIVLRLRRSKGDQDGRGRNIAIPYGRSRWCPVACLDSWLSTAGIVESAIFHPVDRHGHVCAARLSGEAISFVVRERIAAAGFDPVGYSGHSLRAGLATSAAQAGVPAWRIKAQTRHASEAMLANYIRQGELFTDNAAGALL